MRRNNEWGAPLAGMPRYFFHLAGEIPAHDVHGHECSCDAEAKQHAEFIAHRIGSEKPEMVRDGNFVSVTNDRDVEIAQVALASTTAKASSGDG